VLLEKLGVVLNDIKKERIDFFSIRAIKFLYHKTT